MRLPIVSGRVTGVLATGLLLLSAGGLDAQVTVHGRVLEDETEAAIPAAGVILTAPDGRLLQEVVTDGDGFFRFDPVTREAVRLEVSRLGYASTTTSVLHFDEYDLFRVELRLTPEAVLVAPLEVVARSRAGGPVLEGFEDRRATSATGWFFTREDIERLRPSFVTDVVARVPGVRLESSGRGAQRTLSMSRTAAMGRCPVQVFVDGFGLNAGTGGEVALDDAVALPSVEGIEVYRGLSSVPAPFMSPEAHCGVVAIWTRRGGPPNPR